MSLITLPAAIQGAVAPLFDALPLDQAMSKLIVHDPGPTELVREIIQSPAIGTDSLLASGLWLYVDQLDLSHDISQKFHDQTGSFWHGIMHRREGDFGNSHYWFRKVGQHPAMPNIQTPDGGDYDGHALIDDVEAGYRNPDLIAELIQRQRTEWAGLFQWCASNQSS